MDKPENKLEKLEFRLKSNLTINYKNSRILTKNILEYKLKEKLKEKHT